MTAYDGLSDQERNDLFLARVKRLVTPIVEEQREKAIAEGLLPDEGETVKVGKPVAETRPKAKIRAIEHRGQAGELKELRVDSNKDWDTNELRQITPPTGGLQGMIDRNELLKA